MTRQIEAPKGVTVSIDDNAQMVTIALPKGFTPTRQTMAG